MKKEELIEKLKSLPDGVEVSIMDWRKNLGTDIGDGSSEGIYPNFEIDLISLSEEESEYFEEQHGKPFVPFIALCFLNEDYDDSGELIELPNE